MSEPKNPASEDSQSHEEPEAGLEAEELSDDDLENVAGGWTGNNGGG